jgi:phosphate starvation-inducible membrane PsiE
MTFLVLLTALLTVVLTRKTSASSEACIVEHPLSTCLLLRMLITFYLYSEFARNSSFFDLKGVGKPFWIKTHRNKGFSTTQYIVIFRIYFKERQI